MQALKERMAGALAGTLLLVVFHPFGLTTNG